MFLLQRLFWGLGWRQWSRGSKQWPLNRWRCLKSLAANRCVSYLFPPKFVSSRCQDTNDLEWDWGLGQCGHCLKHTTTETHQNQEDILGKVALMTTWPSIFIFWPLGFNERNIPNHAAWRNSQETPTDAWWNFNMWYKWTSAHTHYWSKRTFKQAGTERVQLEFAHIRCLKDVWKMSERCLKCPWISGICMHLFGLQLLWNLFQVHFSTVVQASNVMAWGRNMMNFHCPANHPIRLEGETQEKTGQNS